MKQANQKTLRLESIRTDGGTQMRERLLIEVVSDYQEKLEEGVDLGELQVVYDGEAYWLWDGFHRLEAYRLNGALEAPCTVEEGSRRDAVLKAAGANQQHGLRRDWPAKRRAVLTLLQDEEWSKYSNPEIAKLVGVSKEFVRLEREKLEGYGKPYGQKPEIFNGIEGLKDPTSVATVATPMFTTELRKDSTGRLQPAHKPKKKKELTEPDLEYLEETASQDMSLEALQIAWADFRTINGLNEEEFRAALESQTAFCGYLDQIRKQYSKRDVTEAAREILNRLYPAQKAGADSETLALEQTKKFEDRLQELIEEWLKENELGAEVLVVEENELEERVGLDYRLRLTCDLARAWPLVPTEKIGLLLSGYIYYDLPRWLEQAAEAGLNSEVLVSADPGANQLVPQLPKKLDVWGLEQLVRYYFGPEKLEEKLTPLVGHKSKTGPGWLFLNSFIERAGHTYKRSDLKQAISNVYDQICQRKASTTSA